MNACKCTLICCFTFLTMFSFAHEIEDVFPKEVSFEFEGKSFQLQMTGEATRKKFFVSVYNVAHYLQKEAFQPASNKFQSIFNNNIAKELLFRWVRTVEAAKVKEGYDESFKKVLSPNEYIQLQNEIRQFLSYFNREVKKGDEQVIRWLPGGTIEVIIKGEKAGEIRNPIFAKALWSIWLSDKSVVDRDKLVSLIK